MVDPADDVALDLLGAQLARMRGMLYGYSELFFRRIRDWTILAIVLLVVGSVEPFGVAVVFVPFLLPFAFLETGYLFWYTVFARRFAERLERRINERVGADLLIAHRLEAAYFLPPNEPKIAAFSLARPAGFMSVATLGYTIGAALLWLAGFDGLIRFGEAQGGLGGWLPAVAVVWTVAIAAYLVWTFLSRHDEQRLVRALDEWTSDRGQR